ncbi:MAG: glycosyl hydrolase family 18 protein [Gallionella sp.]
MLRLFLAALFLCGTLSAQAQPLKTWGYVAAWMPDGWRDLALQDFERLVFFELAIDEQGNISERNGWPENWSEFRSAASLTPIDVTVRCFDANIVSNVFDKPAAVKRLLVETERIAADEGVAGIQLDFEIYDALKPETIAAYRQFLSTLSSHLHQMSPARKLTVFYSVGDATALYDSESLAQVDYVVVQGYDSHWQRGDESGPLSPLAGDERETWASSLKQVLDAGAQREQVVMSFPLYGYEWPVQSSQPRSKTIGGGRVLYYSAATDDGDGNSIRDRLDHYGYVYDAVSASSYYTYQKNNVWYAGWFEDGYSLRKKSEFIAAQGLRGLAFFALGYDQGELVRNHLKEHAKAR